MTEKKKTAIQLVKDRDRSGDGELRHGPHHQEPALKALLFSDVDRLDAFVEAVEAVPELVAIVEAQQEQIAALAAANEELRRLLLISRAVVAIDAVQSAKAKQFDKRLLTVEGHGTGGRVAGRHRVRVRFSSESETDSGSDETWKGKQQLGGSISLNILGRIEASGFTDEARTVARKLRESFKDDNELDVECVDVVELNHPNGPKAAK